MAGCRSEPGGSLALLDLIEEHRAAFDYDWRSRFHLSLDDVPAVVPWDEALRLTTILAGDPSSQVAAALAGWDGPRSREWYVLADLVDVIRAQHAKKKPQPYPRPADDRKRRLGRTTRPQAAVLAALAARGPRIAAKRDAHGRLHDSRGRYLAG